MKKERSRNHIAKDLAEVKYHQRTKGDKRRYLIDLLHEQEANEDLFEYLGKAPKE